jgi:SAM-dependent methyltransferase
MLNSKSSIPEIIIPDELLPPKDLRLSVGGSFKAIGAEFFHYFIEIAQLQPDEAVLDVGCGVGRMAVPLAGYLSDRGRYEGFDIVEAGIHWCQSVISPRYPNFQFQRADLYNHYYNPTGQDQAQTYQFPYPNQQFDFVFLTSVFTHILPEGIENYLQEISRVLKPGGRALLTAFLLNEDSLKGLNQGCSSPNFTEQCGRYRLADKNFPESAVAYEEPFFLELADRAGLQVRQPIYYGSWCGRANFLSVQDILLMDKPDREGVNI